MRTLSDLLSGRNPWRQQNLGPLEAKVLEVLTRRGESSVRDVLNDLDRPLAYTTVMTTLDRLFKKGLLSRHMAERSFRYLACEPGSRPFAGERAGFFSTQSARELLVSNLLDTVCEYDKTLLDELERNIAQRRRQYEAQADSMEVSQ